MVIETVLCAHCGSTNLRRDGKAPNGKAPNGKAPNGKAPNGKQKYLVVAQYELFFEQPLL